MFDGFYAESGSFQGSGDHLQAFPFTQPLVLLLSAKASQSTQAPALLLAPLRRGQVTEPVVGYSLYIDTWNPNMTSVLIGKGNILGGWWSKREVIQVLNMCRHN